MGTGLAWRLLPQGTGTKENAPTPARLVQALSHSHPIAGPLLPQGGGRQRQKEIQSHCSMFASWRKLPCVSLPRPPGAGEMAQAHLSVRNRCFHAREQSC